MEVSTADGHLLCIGTTLPHMRGVGAAEVVQAIHDRGGIAIPAHPYDRWRSGIRQELLDTLIFTPSRSSTPPFPTKFTTTRPSPTPRAAAFP